MKILSERIERHKKQFLHDSKIEECVEILLFKIPELYNVKVENYEWNPSTICIDDTLDNAEFVLLELIPSISETFNCKWKETINDNSISYTVFISIEYISLYIVITLYQSETCTMKKIATGRIVSVKKTIDINEPEYITEVICGEENG